jgi:hypothetical protein
MTRKDAKLYYDLLDKVCKENQILDKPDHIVNEDEIVLQLNITLERLLATDEAKDVHVLT